MMRNAFFSCAVLLTALARPVLRAEEPANTARRHITLPFKTLKMGAWAPDGQSYTMDIEDRALGKLTLTMRIAAVSESVYTVAADGTDFEASYPLPPETHGAVIVRFKKKQLGEPFDQAKSEALVQFLLAAKYFRYAREACAEALGLPAERREAFEAAIAEGSARACLETAARLLKLGQYDDAGRMLTQATTIIGDAGAHREKLKQVEQDVQALQVKLTAEALAGRRWSAAVAQVKKALEGAHPEEASLIDRLLPDLDGPLPGERRLAILQALHANTDSGVNYGQAMELLKEFSFAVRYGEALERKEVVSLDDFFEAERAVDVYLYGDEKDEPARLDKALAFRGLTDRAFEALVRLGRRAPRPPQATEGKSPQGPFQIEAPKGDLEVGLTCLVMLPADYHPSTRRPLLVALHGMNSEATAAMQFWALEATKRGFIVAAPECVIGRGKGYLSTPEERGLGMRTVADCMRRFAVDPNRVYVAGHSMGGHMTWDLALTFPGTFAAAAPFIGCVNGVSSNYVLNSLHCPVYCVSGERDTSVTKVNRLVNEELKRQKRPMTYVEYLGRGHEGFTEEIPKVLDWMESKERPRAPKEIDFVSADMETAQCFWLAMTDNQTKKQGLPANMEAAVRASGLARLSATVGAGNAVEIKAYNTTGLRIYVTPDLFDLTKPLKVTVNGRVTKLTPIEASRKRMLELVRQSGDRERLYWATVDVAVPK
ncbi:MAG: dienelactone hydrolase family protein [Planctomycetota bacterium]|nr:dienelactone hydrolase family protein [Planctomycetota bacterium]